MDIFEQAHKVSHTISLNGLELDCEVRQATILLSRGDHLGGIDFLLDSLAKAEQYKSKYHMGAFHMALGMNY